MAYKINRELIKEQINKKLNDEIDKFIDKLETELPDKERYLSVNNDKIDLIIKLSSLNDNFPEYQIKHNIRKFWINNAYEVIKKIRSND
jgi:hypothetical protein